METDNVMVKNIESLIVSNNAQQFDLIIGRTFCDRKNIYYIRNGDSYHFGYCSDVAFQNMNMEELSEKREEIISLEVIRVKPGKSQDVKLNTTKGKFVLRVYNSCDKIITSQPGKSLGRFREPVMSQEKCFPLKRLITEEVIMGKQITKAQRQDRTILVIMVLTV